MATYPNTSSTLTNNGHNGTFTGLSTNILIKIGPNTVGAVQELSINENRDLAMIDEIGTDGHIDSTPRRSTNITGSCSRIRYDRMRVTEAFSRGFLHVSAQRIPFDIVVIDSWNGDGNSAIVTTIKNVWIKSIATPYRADNFVITETMAWEAETIYSTLNNAPASTGGLRNIPLSIDSIEQSTDTGGRRGSLDAGGLLQAFLPY